MDWTRIIFRIISLLLTPFALGGCVAMMAVPVNVPIWLILGVVALARPTTAATWVGWTTIIVIQFLMIAAFGLLGAIDSPRSLFNEGFLLYVAAMVISIVGLTIRYANTEVRSWTNRILGGIVLLFLVCGSVVLLLH